MPAQTYCGPILIVDDDDTFRVLLSEILQRMGYATVESARGDEALEAAAQDPPSLVLLDVDVPGLSGYEVCRELRDRYGQELPIIFVSGARVEKLDRIGGLLLGADDYLVKPFDMEELLARIRRHLARSALSGRDRAETVAVLNLTEREGEVLRLLSAGLDQSGIAAELVISPKTVATHIQRVLAKTGVGSRAQLVAFAHRNGLAEPAAAHPSARHLLAANAEPVASSA
jgi:DNA-binding NarL/FixJ family response regulator